MNKIKEHKNGIALLALMLVVGNTTMNGWAKSLHSGLGIEPQPRKELPSAKGELLGSFSIPAFDAHISEVTLGHDKKMTEPSDEFDADDTIFAAVDIEENTRTVTVKARLHIVEVEGQKAGLIPGIEAIVTIKGEGTADFQFSKPTKGWPLGTYKFEALLLDASGKTIDTEEHEFTVE
jgi:hypothetical protein